MPVLQAFPPFVYDISLIPPWLSSRCASRGQRRRTVISETGQSRFSEVALLRSLYLFPLAPVRRVEVIGIDEFGGIGAGSATGVSL